jgi:hypothetical protein
LKQEKTMAYTKTIVLAEWPPRRGSKIGRLLDWAKRINDERPDEHSAANYAQASQEIASALISAMYHAHWAQKFARIADSLSAKERAMLLDAVRFGEAQCYGAGGWNTKRGLLRKKLLMWRNRPTRLGRRVVRFIQEASR